MKSFRHPLTMLIMGTLAGFLSGLEIPETFGLRGALFGFSLSLSVLLMRNEKFRYTALAPGLILGTLLSLIHRKGDPPAIDYITLLNAGLFVPIYAYAYLQKMVWPALWRLTLAGILCTCFRTGETQFKYYELYFFKGTVLFLTLWLIAMGLTDPRFRRKRGMTAWH